jgi:hypothetical protein
MLNPTLSRTEEQNDPKKVFKTPRMEAIWPKVIVPETKFDSAGVYEIRGKVFPEHEAGFLEEMQERYDLAYQQTCHENYKTQLSREAPPWKVDKDGRTIFKFKLKAGGVSDGVSWENKPPVLYDAGGTRITDASHLKIGNGSIVRVFFQIRPYFVQKAGITLRLKGVQILKLVDYDQAAAWGIEPEDGEGSFRYDASVTQPIAEGNVDLLDMEDKQKPFVPRTNEDINIGNDFVPF